MNIENNCIIIEGITNDGLVFRPSDWAERMCGRIATFKKSRIVYSPLLRPGIKNGHKCIILHKDLESSNPALYAHILDFAKINKLVVTGASK